MIYLSYIGAQSDLTQVTTLNEKDKSSTPELNWTYEGEL